LVWPNAKLFHNDRAQSLPNLIFVWRVSALSQRSYNISVHVSENCEMGGILIGDFDAKLFLDSHDQLNSIQAHSVCTGTIKSWHFLLLMSAELAALEILNVS
jgi:hypothetical protein